MIFLLLHKVCDLVYPWQSRPLTLHPQPLTLNTSYPLPPRWTQVLLLRLPNQCFAQVTGTPLSSPSITRPPLPSPGATAALGEVRNRESTSPQAIALRTSPRPHFATRSLMSSLSSISRSYLSHLLSMSTTAGQHLRALGHAETSSFPHLLPRQLQAQGRPPAGAPTGCPQRTLQNGRTAVTAEDIFQPRL